MPVRMVPRCHSKVHQPRGQIRFRLEPRSRWRTGRSSAFMPDGMVALFEGRSWKIPADVQIRRSDGDKSVTRDTSTPPNKIRPDQARAHCPTAGSRSAVTGGYALSRNPAEPHQRMEDPRRLLVPLHPHLVVNTADNLGFGCTQDSFGSINCSKSLWVYRQLAYNTDPDVPQTTPGAEDKFYTTWMMIEEPEQANTRQPDDWIYRPDQTAGSVRIPSFAAARRTTLDQRAMLVRAPT